MPLISLRRALPSGNASSSNYRLVQSSTTPQIAYDSSIPQSGHKTRARLIVIKKTSSKLRLKTRPYDQALLFARFRSQALLSTVLRNSRVNVGVTSLLIAQEFGASKYPRYAIFALHVLDYGPNIRARSL